MRRFFRRLAGQQSEWMIRRRGEVKENRGKK